MKNTYRNLALILITLITISSCGVTQIVQAGGPNALYSVGLTTINGSNPQNGPFGSPITLVGFATGTNFIGALSQYHVEVNWGDGTIDQSPTWISLTQTLEDFSGIWTSTHYYTQTGSFDITVKLYHSQPPGAGGTADAVYTQTDIEISSTTILTLSRSSPQVIGTLLTVSASVLPINATGNVQFQVQTPNSATWSTFDTKTLISASATSIAYLLNQVGAYKFQAAYSGDTVYKTSTSSAISMLVNPTLIVSIDPPSTTLIVDESNTFTANAQYGSGTYTNYIWYVDSNLTPVQNGPTNSYIYSTTKVGQHTISVAVTDNLGNSASNSATITVDPAPVTHFEISGPSFATAGQDFQITITAKDYFEDIVTGYSGIIHLTSTDNQAILPNDSTLTNGSKTFTITLKTAGEQSLTATDTTDNAIAGTSNLIIVEYNIDNPGYIVITPSTTTITTGSSQTYNAELFDVYGNSVGSVSSTVTWSINSGQGTCIWTGNSVQVNKEGTWTVTATYTGVQDATATLTVTGHAAPTSISIQPKTSSIAAGQIQSYTVVATDTFNTWDITTTLTWTINSSAGGFWTGPTYTSENAGAWTVTASLGVLTDNATLTVNPNMAQLSHITILPKEQTIAAGESQSFTATAYDIFGNSWDVSTQATWSIIEGNDAGVWTNNIYASHNAGTFTVQAKYEDKTAETTLTVTHSTDIAYIDHISIAPETQTIAAGQTQSYTATATDSFGNNWDVSTQATWTIPSSNDEGSWNQNIYTSNKAGTYTITATYNGKTDTATLTVNIPPQSYAIQQTYKFTFTQTGLPEDKTWSATFNGQTKTSTGSTISFNVPAGVYSWSIQGHVMETEESRYTAFGLNAASIRVPETTSYSIKYSPQFKLTIISNHGTATGDGWYFTGETANIGITSPDTQGDTRYTFTSWTGDLTSTTPLASILMNAPKTIYANWNTQYLLTINSEYGNPKGAGWYNSGTKAQFTIQDQTTDSSGTQYSFTNWVGTGNDSYTGPDRTHTVTMNTPITETANWEPSTSLYSVLLAALIIFIIIIALLLAWRRRKKKKATDTQ